MSLTDIEVGSLGDAARVGGNDKGNVVHLQSKTDIVAAVVAGLEGRDGDGTNFEWKLFVDGLMIVGDATRGIVPPQQAVKGLGSDIDAHVGVVSQKGIGITHVVVMVVRQEYASDSAHVYAVGGKPAENVVIIDTGIDKHTARRRADIGTVARRTAAKRHKAQMLGALLLIAVNAGHGEHRLGTLIVKEPGGLLNVGELFAFLSAACH